MKTLINVTAYDEKDKAVCGNIIQFSDEEIGLKGMLTIKINDKEIGRVEMNEILSALIAFDSKYSRINSIE